jgi:hypothetical protein
METKKQNNNSEEGRKEEICRRRRIRKEEELNGLWVSDFLKFNFSHCVTISLPSFSLSANTLSHSSSQKWRQRTKRGKEKEEDPSKKNYMG